MFTPGIELAPSRLICQRSSHCATYALKIQLRKFSYVIRYSRLKRPKTPFFPSSVAHSHFDFNEDNTCFG